MKSVPTITIRIVAISLMRISDGMFQSVRLNINIPSIISTPTNTEIALRRLREDTGSLSFMRPILPKTHAKVSSKNRSEDTLKKLHAGARLHDGQQYQRVKQGDCLRVSGLDQLDHDRQLTFKNGRRRPKCKPP